MLRVLDFYSANHVRRTTPPLGPDMDGSLAFEPLPGRLPEEMQRMDAIPDIGAPEPLGDQHCCMLDDALGDSGPVWKMLGTAQVTKRTGHWYEINLLRLPFRQQNKNCFGAFMTYNQ